MSETNAVKDESERNEVERLQPVVMCVGVDNKRHCFRPHEDKTCCGISIKRKKVLRDDWMLFYCWECTY